MVSTLFQSVLKEFEPFFQCKLETDDKESCLVKMAIGLEVQIELNAYGYLLIGCKLGALLGRYRDLVFKEALKANYLHAPTTGVFGYSQKSKNLILFLLLDPKSLKPDNIPNIMNPFIAKAKLWADSIARGATPSTMEGKPKGKSDNIFGIQT